MRKILPLLVSPEDKSAPSFHVVALGLPGFGFSEQPHKRGFGPIQAAEVGHKLMLALGYSEYVTQGGDWGSIVSYSFTCVNGHLLKTNKVTRVISALYGKTHAKAWHTNVAMCVPSHAPFLHRLYPILTI